MNIKYNNSMYTINPPLPIEEPCPLEEDMFDEPVDELLYEQQFFKSYEDLEEIRNRELIKNEQI